MTSLVYPLHQLAHFLVGQSVEKKFQISQEELLAFIAASDDQHPLHTDRDFSITQGYPETIVHGMAVASRCSAFVAQEFIGRLGLLVSVSSEFRAPVYCGEILVWGAEVAKIELKQKLMEVKWTVQKDSKLITQRGSACILFR